jgi:hypothetical protein
MPSGPGQVLNHLSRASWAKWQALSKATESWPKTFRLAFLLLVVQIPITVGVVIWAMHA